METNKQIFYHVSNKFKNSECMQFLEAFVDKYDKILSLVTYSKHSYNRTIQGTEITYQKEEEKGTTIKIKENNYYIGNITIHINKYKNCVKIIDNMNHNSNNLNIKTSVIQLNLSAGGMSYINFSTYNNYGTKYQKLNKATHLVFDNSGVLINYEELEGDSNSSKNNGSELKDKYGIR